MKCSGIGVKQAMLPLVPGQVVVGTIEGIGSEVDKVFKIGDRVIGIVDSGGCSRYLSADAHSFVKAPSSLSNYAALALMQDWMPAYRALHVAKNSLRIANLFGMKILITDAMSAMGQAIIALATEEGAKIYCCAEKSHHEYLKSLGFKITCLNPQLEQLLPDLRGRIDVVIDSGCVDSYASFCEDIGLDHGVFVSLPRVSFDDGKLFGLFDVGVFRRKIDVTKARISTAQVIDVDTIKEFKFISEDETSADKRANFVRDLQYLTLLYEKGTIQPKIAEKISLRAVSSVHKKFKSGIVGTGGTVICLPWRKE